MPTLSVLIPTRNRPQKARRAVDSVLANSFGDFELIVVDQSTDRLTQEALYSIHDPRLRYISTDTVGAAISRNIAIRAARADTVVFTDDDCVCERDWLTSILAEYAAEPTALGIFGRVVPYGNFSDKRGILGQSGDMFCPAVQTSLKRAVFEAPAIPHLVLGGGNNMSFRKELFRKIGLFHETLGPGSRIGTGEDTEMSYRILWHRCKLVYSPRPLVHHDNWLDRPQFIQMMKVAMRAQAAVFLPYALRFDGLAFYHLVRTGWHLLRNRMGIGSSWAGLAYFASGLARGPGYCFLRPPPL
jgi:glycosyltransferase involved in cell wall biosynthesis